MKEIVVFVVWGEMVFAPELPGLANNWQKLLEIGNFGAN
jgi:hypothetical protein